jgi:protein required for attachment to host cells/ribosome-associated translation inhibitor RaiA
MKPFARGEKSDKPGRNFGASKSAIRHAVEPRHDYHKLAKRAFTRAMADALAGDAAEGKFDAVVIAAPKRTLGELRKLLPEGVRKQVVLEIPKDLVKCPSNELLALIKPELSRKRIVPRKEQPASGVPELTRDSLLTVLYRDLHPAEAAERRIRSRTDKLRKRFPRIESFKVTVEGSHAHHRKGRLYRVTAFIRLPGSTITVNSSGTRGSGHDNVFRAIDGAFDAADRSLESYRHTRSSGSPSERSSSLQSGRADTI